MTAPISSTELDMWERDLRHAHALATVARDDYSRATTIAERHAADRRHRVGYLVFSSLVARYAVPFGAEDVARAVGEGMTAREVAGIIEDLAQNRFLVVGRDPEDDYTYVALDPARPIGSTGTGAWSQGVR